MTKKIETMNEKEFWEEYSSHEKLFWEIRNKTNPTEFERIYRHDAGNYINSLSGTKNTELKFSDLELIETDENMLKNQLKTLISIEKILNCKGFSKEEMKSEIPLYFEQALRDPCEDFTKRYGIEIDLNVNGTKIYALDSMTKALLLTNLGDAIKWSPKNSPIKIYARKNGSNIYLNMENNVSEKIQIPKIGEGKGVGTKYTNLFLNGWGGKMEKSKINGKYKKEFLLPID